METQSASSSSPGQQDRHELRRNSMGVAHIVFFVVAAAAPLTVVGSLYAIIIGVGNGDGIAGAFLLVALVLLIFAVGYTAMSRHVVDAGDFYAFVSVGLGRPMGLGAAGVAVFAYTSIQLGLFGAFGYYANRFAEDHFHVDAGWWFWAFVSMAACLVLGIRRIDLGAKIMGVLLVCETISVIVVDIAIVGHGMRHGHSFTFSPLSPSTTFSGAVGVAVMFCHASFVGFEGTAIYGEESRDPTKTVPRATYVAVAFMGVFYTVTAWLIINAFGSGGAVAAANKNAEGFFFDIGDRLIGGPTRTTLSLLIVTSMFAAIVAFHNNVSRYLFALGRQGVLWRQLGRTHGTRKSPWVACCVQTASVFLIVLAFAIAHRDPFVDLFTWMTGIGAVGVIILQSMAGLAILVFFRRRPDLDNRVWNCLIAPVLGLLGLLTLLFLAFKNIDTLVGASSTVETSLLVILAGSFVVGLVAALWWRVSAPARYGRLGAQLQDSLVSLGHHETAVPVDAPSSPRTEPV